MKNFNKVLLGLIALVLAITVLIPSPQVVSAAGDTSRYKTQFLSGQYSGMKVIAQAYLTGGDKEPDNGNKIAISPIPSNLTKIQGYTIKDTHKRRDNMKNLAELYRSVIGARPSYDYSIEYLELEGAKLDVVAIKGDSIIFWSNGYRGFSNFGPGSCDTSDWLMTHAPGFYSLPISAVWLYYPSSEYNSIPDGMEDTYETTGTVIAKGALITQRKAVLYTRPEASHKTYAYRVKYNTKLKVVSSEPIPATDGSKDTYYKVIFKGNTAVNYMANYCYLYIKSTDVDVLIENDKTPDDLQPAYTKNIAAGMTEKLYAKDKKTVVAKIQVHTNLWWSKSNDIKGYRAIWYNGQLCYLKNKYFQKGEFVEKLHATNLRIKDVVDGQYLLTWDKTTTPTDYTLEIVNEVDGMEQYLYFRDEFVVKNEYLIDSSYFDPDGNKRSYIHVRVFANDNSGRSHSTYIKLQRLTPLEETEKPSWDEIYYTDKAFETFIDFNAAAQVQMSTDKNFKKNVVTHTSRSNAKTFEDLTPGTTYYFRFRHAMFLDTDAGEKVIGGPWSEVKALSTKEKTIYKEVKEVFYKDMKDNKVIIGWNAVEGATAYKVAVQSIYMNQPIQYSNSNYTKTEITIKPEWYELGTIRISVSAKVNGKWTTEQTLRVDMLFYPEGKPDATYQEYYTDDKGIYLTNQLADALQIQVSTDKTFDDKDPIYEKAGDYVAADGLKSDTTYYFRYRLGFIFNAKKDLGETTKKETKSIWSDEWSDTIKVKTTK